MLFHAVFDASKNSFTCQFAVGYYFDTKSCIIKYGIIDVSYQSCDIQIETRNISNNTLSDNVTILIPTLSPTESKYCFIAIGKVGNLSIAVEGTFSVKGKRSGSIYNGCLYSNDRIHSNCMCMILIVYNFQVNSLN